MPFTPAATSSWSWVGYSRLSPACLNVMVIYDALAGPAFVFTDEEEKAA